MPLLLLFAFLGLAANSHAAPSCAVVPGSIPAGTVELKDILAQAASHIQKEENLEVALFGLG